MTFGDDWGWGAAKEEAQNVYNAFREAGGNFIDTANLYTNGASESFLGEFVKGHRQSMVLVIPIIGARKLSQLEDNLASLDLSLSADQLKSLEEASRIELGFPHELYVKELTRAFIHGGMRDRIIANNF
jgi:aryl-alcohol dehydrogenase-like predicted oxidoreductase